jgi:hypothetical protein
MSHELLRRALECFEELGQFNSEICQICKDIEVELARPIDKQLLSQYREQIESLKLTIIAKESDLRERESAVKSWAEALAKERFSHAQTIQELHRVRKPLSFERITELGLKANISSNPYRSFARMIEEDHGIL